MTKESAINRKFETMFPGAVDSNKEKIPSKVNNQSHNTTEEISGIVIGCIIDNFNTHEETFVPAS